MVAARPVRVLILAPDSPFIDHLTGFLESRNPPFEAVKLGSMAAYRRWQAENKTDVLLCGDPLPDSHSIELLSQSATLRPPVIVLGQSNLARHAAEAIHAGACDYWHMDEAGLEQLPALIVRAVRREAQKDADGDDCRPLSHMLMNVIQAIPGMLTVQNRARELLLSNFIAVPPLNERGEYALRCYQAFGCGESVCAHCPSTAVFETGKPIRMEQSAPDTDRTYEVTIFPIKDASGQVILTGEYRRDISHQREMARELLDSEEKYLALAENSSDIICRLDRQTRILYVNAAIHRLLGIEPDAVYGRRAFDLGKSIGFFSAFAPHVEEVFASGKSRAFGALHERDGLTIEFDCRLSPEFARDGSVMSVIAGARDMSDLRRTLNQKKQLESQLIQVQKMESMGRLAGGVAHDFNNFLTGVTGNVSLALISHQNDPELAEIMEEILVGAERAAGLTRQLLAFSRKQKIESRPMNLNDAVENLLKMLGRIIGEDICLSLKLDPELPPIMADVGQIEQVIVNLAVNARDAMPNGGNLTISTDVSGIPAIWREANPRQADRAVRLRISDTGIGMDEQTQRMIFEPFFTTKPQGKGTGLGLSTVYGIASQHKAHIECESTPGMGTTFSLYFPVGDARCAASFDSRTRGHFGAGGSESILLVEDDQTVREISTKILEAAGYRVISTESAAQALARFEEVGGSVDLVVTDVIMPNRNGRELADDLLMRRPDLRILFVSGYTHDVVITRGVSDDHHSDFLSKPFTPQQLTAKVREMLDREG